MREVASVGKIKKRNKEGDRDKGDVQQRGDKDGMGEETWVSGKKQRVFGRELKHNLNH